MTAMKLVEFNRAMSPYVAGETRLVPDGVAAQLLAGGVIKDPPADWPAKPAAAKPAAAPAPAPQPARRKQLFRTK